MLFVRLGLIATLSLPTIPVSLDAEPVEQEVIAVTTTTTTTTVPTDLANKVKAMSLEVLPEELQTQMRKKKTMPIAYWEAVAVCETDASRRGWTDKGKWAGGLGIYVGTWNNWGGRQFAPTPDKATKHEQIIVANRISVFGFQTKNKFRTLDDKINNRPWFQHKVGFFGWGCIKNNRYLHPEVWKKNHSKKKVHSNK